MELIVKDYEQPTSIEFNFEELKQELSEKVAHYETLVYTDDQIKEAKTDRANLNKLKKALNDERLRREREYMAPFTEFKNKVNEIIEIIDKPVALIDAQVKAYEEKCREDKKSEIIDYFEGLEHKTEWLTLNMIWNESWLNASVSMKSIETDIQEAVNQVLVNVDTLKSLTEFSFEALEVYKDTLDINRAIFEGKRLADMQKRKLEEEQRRLEEEKKRAEAANTDPTECLSSGAEEVCRQDPPKEETGRWIGFKAFLTMEQALKLRDFFRENDIVYQPMAVN